MARDGTAGLGDGTDACTLCAADGLADHRAGLIGRVVAGPDDVTVGTHEHEARLVGSAPVATGVADGFQGHAQRACRLLERRDGCVWDIEREQAETGAELLEDVPPGPRLRATLVRSESLYSASAASDRRKRC